MEVLYTLLSPSPSILACRTPKNEPIAVKDTVSYCPKMYYVKRIFWYLFHLCTSITSCKIRGAKIDYSNNNTQGNAATNVPEPIVVGCSRA